MTNNPMTNHPMTDRPREPDPHPSAKGDVIRDHWPVEMDKSVNLYLGNGRCGGCFDAWGLQHQALDSVARRVSNTWLAHAEVFHHGRYGFDTQVPLARLAWDSVPGEPTRYRQHLRLADGSLETEFENDDISYLIRSWTDPEERDCLYLTLSWKIRSSRAPRAVTLRPVATHEAYSTTLAARSSLHEVTGTLGLFIDAGSASGLVLANARGDASWSGTGQGLSLVLTAPEGQVDCTLAQGPAARAGALRVAVQSTGLGATDSWRRRWRNTQATILDPAAEKLWWRSVYHILATYGPDVRCPAPPMGFTGNGWGFHFPQDLSYIHPVLLRLGHVDIAQALVEFYASRLGQQERMTRRIYNRPGVMWAWAFPIGEDEDQLADETPNWFQYEIHNAAYPARMAYETALALGDPTWSREIAWPIVHASAKFLSACLSRGADGLWGLEVTPSMGQDESGGENAPDYLCALFSTEYALQAALDLAHRLGDASAETETWRMQLAAGLAYPRLLLPDGFYRTNTAAPFVPGKQKHPVQLNPLTFLPLGRIDAPIRAAWRARHAICAVQREGMHHPGVPGCFYEGWTLFAFLLAAARIGDSVGFAHEWKQAVPSQHVDPDLITIYETSGYWVPYYTTSMGLFVQAMLAVDDAPEVWLKQTPAPDKQGVL